MSEERGKAWGGRFQKRAAAALERFSSSIEFDRKLWREDLAGSVAHARMLAARGILSSQERDTLVGGLEAIGREFAEGRFELDPSAEDVHMNVERRLYQLIGPVAGKLHTGRSRNDQVATDLLLYMRRTVDELRTALLGLRRVLVERAAREVDVILPGYTHLQRAQPVRLAHHWLAHFEALTRDDARLAGARSRMDACPLGAGALAGSTLDLDRQQTARELGFERPAANSLDAVASRDVAAELVATLAISMTHLSRLSEELVLWSSTEFGFVEMDDAFATGSSLMPQKKNPDVPELVRGKTGRVIGDVVALLTLLKGLPLAYNRDLQEDKEPLFDAVETAHACYEILAGTLESLVVRDQAMARAAQDPMLLATDLAELLVERGVAFREAHELVGRVVAHSQRTGISLAELDAETLRDFHPELVVDAASFFSAPRSLEARRGVGGLAKERVEQAIQDARDRLRETERALARERS